jgi:hypothetical protein
MEETIKNLIKNIEDAYAVGAIGYSVYIMLITDVRSLQVAA